MARKVFAVINTRGPRWDDSRPMEEHEGWRAHADFMNALVADGFVLLGGPLAGTRDVLLVVRAENEAEVEARSGADCWTDQWPCCETLLNGRRGGPSPWLPWARSTMLRARP